MTKGNAVLNRPSDSSRSILRNTSRNILPVLSRIPPMYYEDSHGVASQALEPSHSPGRPPGPGGPTERRRRPLKRLLGDPRDGGGGEGRGHEDCAAEPLWVLAEDGLANVGDRVAGNEDLSAGEQGDGVRKELDRMLAQSSHDSTMPWGLPSLLPCPWCSRQRKATPACLKAEASRMTHSVSALSCTPTRKMHAAFGAD
eukprot:CAMPEP_0114172026 /NCGR_PEP_ID=MMETSP0043_2-20121206/35027_1 /TAXON_ID=464988 /ORGANISM="Hemiselmis andersenii, Strain CCMP644" /LENGTH=198 /DNA_ID=CAMNT_0001269817 /DNA_START=221 /DNA_END=820 /DNA_ORIENTATION=+